MYFIPSNIKIHDMDANTAAHLADDISHLYIGGTSVDTKHGDHLVEVAFPFKLQSFF